MPKQRHDPDAPRRPPDADVERERHDGGLRHIDDEPIEGDHGHVGLQTPDTDQDVSPELGRADEQRDEEGDVEREEQRGDLT